MITQFNFEKDMTYLPKLTTSKTFNDLSLDMVHNKAPDELTLASCTLPR